MKKLSFKEKEQLIWHLIKACEKFNLTEKESVETINKVSDKKISRRTYYNYKNKLYNKKIIQQFKGSIYDTQALRYLILDIEETDRRESIKADKLISEQLPDRNNRFHDTNKQKIELEKLNEKTKSMIQQFENQMNEPLQRYETIPKNANIREEFIKCGKENCNNCSHGPYYYAYWIDISTKKLKKKYLGVMDPRQ